MSGPVGPNSSIPDGVTCQIRSPHRTTGRSSDCVSVISFRNKLASIATRGLEQVRQERLGPDYTLTPSSGVEQYQPANPRPRANSGFPPSRYINLPLVAGR